MRNYPCRLHPAPVLCILLYALSVQFSTHASNSPLPASCSPLLASDFLPPALSALSPLLPALSALCPQPSAFCFLLLAHSASTLYSLLSTHCFCALSSLLSALCSLLSAFLSLPFNIGTLRKMVFREVVSMGSEPQLFHTSKKRVRSATSRRTPTLSVCYQLAFFTPGIRPFEAISRNWIRLMPN